MTKSMYALLKVPSNTKFCILLFTNTNCIIVYPTLYKHKLYHRLLFFIFFCPSTQSFVSSSSLLHLLLPINTKFCIIIFSSSSSSPLCMEPFSVVDLALFHSTERKLYRLLVEKLGFDADSAKAAIALWLWMESIGYHDLARRIFFLDDHLLREAMEEAQTCANALRQDSPRPTSHYSYLLPLTANLVTKTLNLGLLHHSQDMAASGVAHFLHKICDVIFTDSVTKLLESRFSASSSSSSSSSTLNPMARPWEPHVGRRSEEERSMFLTFSRGYPLTKEEILAFFASYVL